MWAEPWLGSEEAQMEPDIAAILRKAAGRHWGKILQKRAKGPGNAQEGTPGADALSIRPPFLCEVHADPNLCVVPTPLPTSTS